MRFLTCMSLILLAAVAGPAHAAWPWGPANAAPVCAEAGYQSRPLACADGAGGVLVAWRDQRFATAVYAQHLDAQGVRLWSTGGVKVADGDWPLALCSDAAGGAIVVWSGAGTGDLRAQRLSADGSAHWAAGGVPLATGVALTMLPYCTFAPDGAGGLYGAWLVPGAGSGYDVRAQHLDAAGAAAWAAGGALVLAGTNAVALESAPAGASGWLLATCERTTAASRGLRLHRYSPAGDASWPGGVLVQAGGSPMMPALVALADGGAVVAWNWTDVAAISYLSVQRVSAAGVPAWSVPAPVLDFGQLDPDPYSARVLAGGAGDFLVAWRAPSGVLRTQRLAADGAKAWEFPHDVCTGVPLAGVGSGEPSFHVAGDGSDGAYFVFEVPDLVTPNAIRAARQTAAGAAPWGGEGVLVTSQVGASLAESDGGDAIVAFGAADIFAQRLHPDGTLGDFPLAVAPGAGSGLRVAPNPARGVSRITFETPVAGGAHVEVVDLQGRRVARLLDAPLTPGPHALAWDGRDDDGAETPPGLYLVVIRTAGARETLRVVRLP